MSMTESQTAAFSHASGYAPLQSSLLWLGVVSVLVTLYAAWVLHTLYKGWAGRGVTFGVLGATAARVLLMVLVLMFFTLS